MLQDLSDELRTLEQDQLLRQPVTLDAIEGAVVRIAGHPLVSWCSNDYLGLSQHPALADAAARAAAEWGVGARGSRLLAGTTQWHGRLEEALAGWFGAEAALVFPSGYLANLGVLGVLCAPGDLIVIDRLAHASLVDAARASRATLRVFRHNDVGQLASLLSRAHTARRRVVVTEGVFSMEGDGAPLAELAELAERHDALVYLDDAHGVFVLGVSGRGSPEAAGAAHARFLYMGTLGKALGCQGGFVIGPAPLIDVLRNRARTFLYSTALAVPVAAAAVAALELLDREPHHRARLRARMVFLQTRLGGSRTGSGLPITVQSHIVPVIVGETRKALALAQHLWDQGHWAPAIRPPTVPRWTARLRLSVTALHTDSQIDSLAQVLEEGLRRLQRT